MLKKKKEHPKKIGLHQRNKHQGRYHFKELIISCPELAPFVRLNNYNDESIDFSDAEAVMMLNKALLMHFYEIDYWNIPQGYLCPPIPGRADYIHHIADLLGSSNNGIIPTGSQVKCLDIGVGANCIYPIIGNKEYGWSFVGSDIDPISIQSATEIIEKNTSLKENVTLRLQLNPEDIFRGIINKNEYYDLTICNPPFHASAEEAQAGTLRKLSNLNRKKVTKTTLNFGGKNKELWCEGGEEKFIQKMILQSKEFASSCLWFSTLVAKQTHLKTIYNALKTVKAVEVKTISMSQGNKTSRIVAWTFLTPKEQQEWVKTKWKTISH
ncbi:MAG: 23S rRNA (adenine(1618)-N(6))-methyltransferase RlmF [Flavobacteriales bacterium]|nr:23S rRNA (adenine(1618)-N(6))-methyltransferase RlmF [Flavobacteriales bacterium]